MLVLSCYLEGSNSLWIFRNYLQIILKLFFWFVLLKLFSCLTIYWSILLTSVLWILVMDIIESTADDRVLFFIIYIVSKYGLFTLTSIIGYDILLFNWNSCTWCARIDRTLIATHQWQTHDVDTKIQGIFVPCIFTVQKYVQMKNLSFALYKNTCKWKYILKFSNIFQLGFFMPWFCTIKRYITLFRFAKWSINLT